VSRWVRDVEITDDQRAILVERAANGLIKGRTMNANIRREVRLRSQEEGRALARRCEPLHLAGCLLYWAEGSRARNQLRFTNSDPEMVRFFVRFLRTYFDIRAENIRITCNLFTDHVARQYEIEQYWVDVAGLSRASLNLSTVNTYSKYSQKKRRNKLPFGTCRVSVSRTQLTQHIFGAIQEYGGFARPEWLE
jgi:hypothetical protein